MVVRSGSQKLQRRCRLLKRQPVSKDILLQKIKGFRCCRADVLKLPVHAAGRSELSRRTFTASSTKFLVISYETDPDLIRAGLPEPLEPIETPIVHYEWIKMPDSSGFGSYTEVRPRDPGAAEPVRKSTSSTADVSRRRSA